jgi:hypothetical protein
MRHESPKQVNLIVAARCLEEKVKELLLAIKITLPTNKYLKANQYQRKPD